MEEFFDWKTTSSTPPEWMVEFVSSSVKSAALESMAEADPWAFSQPDSSAIKLLNSFLYDCGRTFVQNCQMTASTKTFFPECFDTLWTYLTYLRSLDEKGTPLVIGNKNYNFRSYSRRKIQMIYCTGMKERLLPGGRRDRSSGGGGNAPRNQSSILPSSSSSSSSVSVSGSGSEGTIAIGSAGGSNVTIDGIEMWKD